MPPLFQGETEDRGAYPAGERWGSPAGHQREYEPRHKIGPGAKFSIPLFVKAHPHRSMQLHGIL
jgi:hypothetical protein